MPPADLAHGSCYFSSQEAVNSGEPDHTRSFIAKIRPSYFYERWFVRKSLMISVGSQLNYWLQMTISRHRSERQPYGGKEFLIIKRFGEVS